MDHTRPLLTLDPPNIYQYPDAHDVLEYSSSGPPIKMSEYCSSHRARCLLEDLIESPRRLVELCRFRPAPIILGAAVILVRTSYDWSARLFSRVIPSFQQPCNF